MKQSRLILIWLLAPAQVHAAPDLGVAVKGGFNAATLATDYRVNRYGFSGGLGGLLRWPQPGRFALAGQVDLLYTPRGADVVFEGIPQGTVRQHYLDVVVAAHPEVRLGPASAYLLLGGGVNFLVSANDRSVLGPSRDITDGLHRIDVSLVAGAGVALRLHGRWPGPFHLDAVFLEARHDRGLIDVGTMNDGFLNRNTSLMLGLSFALKSEASARRAARS